MILADTPLFIRMVVMEPVKLLRATQSPLADVNVAVDVSGKRSCRPTKRTPKTRSVDPVHKWTRMHPPTAAQPQPPSVGRGASSESPGVSITMFYVKQGLEYNFDILSTLFMNK